MARFQQLHRGTTAVQNDGHFVIDVVRGCGGDGVGAIDSRKAFHDRSFAAAARPSIDDSDQAVYFQRELIFRSA
jgi:hypothetical protein